MSAKLAVRPLTEELWPAFETLFVRALVAAGPSPGLLAFDGDTPVGWCQLTPRSSLVYLESRPKLRSPDDRLVWCISCFYVRPKSRRAGVTAALGEAAKRAARAAGALALEAYPLDASATSSSSFTGYASTFLRAGFREVARHTPAQPILSWNPRAAASPPVRVERRKSRDGRF